MAGNQPEQPGNNTELSNSPASNPAAQDLAAAENFIKQLLLQAQLAKNASTRDPSLLNPSLKDGGTQVTDAGQPKVADAAQPTAPAADPKTAHWEAIQANALKAPAPQTQESTLVPEAWDNKLAGHTSQVADSSRQLANQSFLVADASLYDSHNQSKADKTVPGRDSNGKTSTEIHDGHVEHTSGDGTKIDITDKTITARTLEGAVYTRNKVDGTTTYDDPNKNITFQQTKDGAATLNVDGEQWKRNAQDRSITKLDAQGQPSEQFQNHTFTKFNGQSVFQSIASGDLNAAADKFNKTHHPQPKVETFFNAETGQRLIVTADGAKAWINKDGQTTLQQPGTENEIVVDAHGKVSLKTKDGKTTPLADSQLGQYLPKGMTIKDGVITTADGLVIKPKDGTASYQGNTSKVDSQGDIELTTADGDQSSLKAHSHEWSIKDAHGNVTKYNQDTDEVTTHGIKLSPKSVKFADGTEIGANGEDKLADKSLVHRDGSVHCADGTDVSRNCQVSGYSEHPVVDDRSVGEVQAVIDKALAEVEAMVGNARGANPGDLAQLESSIGSIHSLITLCQRNPDLQARLLAILGALEESKSRTQSLLAATKRMEDDRRA